MCCQARVPRVLTLVCTRVSLRADSACANAAPRVPGSTCPGYRYRWRVRPCAWPRTCVPVSPRRLRDGAAPPDCDSQPPRVTRSGAGVRTCVWLRVRVVLVAKRDARGGGGCASPFSSPTAPCRAAPVGLPVALPSSPACPRRHTALSPLCPGWRGPAWAAGPRDPSTGQLSPHRPSGAVPDPGTGTRERPDGRTGPTACRVRGPRSRAPRWGRRTRLRRARAEIKLYFCRSHPRLPGPSPSRSVGRAGKLRHGSTAARPTGPLRPAVPPRPAAAPGTLSRDGCGDGDSTTLASALSPGSLASPRFPKPPVCPRSSGRWLGGSFRGAG